MTTLHIDFETRSTLDLTEVGLHNYATHDTTSVLCMAYAFDDEPVDLWLPALEDLPTRVRAHVYDGLEVVAHNAAFEIALWNNVVRPRHGAPYLLPASTTCTMAMAYAMALPGALDAAASATGLGIGKDDTGRRLMLQLCRPRSVNPIVWWDSPEKLAGLYRYCKQDVEVERALHKRLMPLSSVERQLWQLDYKINNRGILIDKASVESAIKVVEYEQNRLNGELRQITQGAVGSVTEVASLTKWIKSQGVEVPGLAKADVIEALAQEDIPSVVRQALLLRQEAGRASTSKLSKMMSASSADGRLRNTLQYHGAGTGRWAGRLVQVHNLPRPTIHSDEVLEYAFELVKDSKTPEVAARALECVIGPPSEVLVSMLRGMIVPSQGAMVAAGDFANIEGRVLAWEAGEEWKVKAFRDFDAGIGADIYKLSYSKSFDIPVELIDKNQRQIGKTSELACGYGGGVGAFQTMAKAFNLEITDTQAEEIKTAWREAHPRIVKYWYDVERAAIDATTHKGHKFSAGPKDQAVTFLRKGSFLMCRLPSKRVLFYPYPEVRKVNTPWGAEKDMLTYKTVPSQTTRIVLDSSNSGRWARVATYGGKLVENITQALARDLLAESLSRLDAAGYDIVMHVHDEIVVEIQHIRQIQELEDIMEVVPNWALGLPVAVKAWAGKRYKKD